MKSSRAMLLTAFMAVTVPAFASEADKVKQVEQTVAKTAEQLAQEAAALAKKAEDEAKGTTAPETNTTNTPPAPTTPTTETPKPGIMAQIGSVIAFPFVFAATHTNNATGWIANNTFNIPLKYIASFECLKDGRFAKQVNNNNIGRALVVLTAMGIAYKVYDSYQNNTQDDAGDDEQLFMEE